MSMLLVIATLVGGLAGVMYLYEKWFSKKAAEAEPMVVENNYPMASGLQQRLSSQGYQIRWSRVDRIASRELEGWEIVVDDIKGRARSFRLKVGSILIKVKQSNIRVIE